MAKTKKSKSTRINEAIASLQRAWMMDEPHIQIRFPGGMLDTPQSKVLLQSLKVFTAEYKKFYGLKKVDFAILMD